MSEQPRVPGYRVTGVAGVGRSSAVWAAQAADGDRVVLRILRVETAAERALLEGRCARLQRVSHPAIAPLHEWVNLPDDRVALVSTLVDGPTVATMHTARHGLSAGECLALARALLEAAARLHGEGVVHGDVAPANVVLTSDGVRPVSQSARPQAMRPVLVDLVALPGRERGTAGFHAPELRTGGTVGAPADVYAIATTAVWAAAPTERHRVRDRLGGLLAHDPDRRPSAFAAARALADETEPIRPAESEALAAATLRERAARTATTRAPAHRPRRQRRGRHRRRRPVPFVVALVVAGLLTAAAGTGWAVHGPGLPPRSLLEAADPVEMIQARVLQLSATRDEALRTADPDLLSTVTVPGSAAAADDAALLESLQRAGEQVVGLVSEVTEVTVLGVQADQARVRAVVTQSAHERADTSGQVRPVAMRGPRCAHLILTRYEHRWRITEATACG